MKKEKESDFSDQDGNNIGIDINADENRMGTSHLNEPVEDETEIERLKLQLEEQKINFCVRLRSLKILNGVTQKKELN